MGHLIVEKAFDYRWPSGSLTAYRLSKDVDGKPTVLTVKGEVLAYAIDKGFGKDAGAKKATPKSERIEVRDILTAEKNEAIGFGSIDPKDV